MVSLDKLKQVIEKTLITKMKTTTGLTVFAKNRSKFENWLQVELVTALQEGLPETNIIPEWNNIDIYIEPDCGIELKIVVTTFNKTAIKEKGSRAVTDSINSIISDINKLKAIENLKEKAVLFVIYPLPEKGNINEEATWEKTWENGYLQDIKKNAGTTETYEHEFSFFNLKATGAIYIAKIE